MAIWSKLAATLAFTFCGAVAAQAAPVRMPLGAEVLAPAGFVDFCQRQPADCGAPAPEKSAAADAGLAPGAVGPARPAMTPPRLGAGLWSRLNRVNAEVNRAIQARTDREAFGLSDYWQTPIGNGRGYGDCEDYVLEKIRALSAAGLPREAMNIALVVTPAGEAHAVLLVDTRDGEFVLDNLTGSVTAWNRSGYRWISRQVGGDARDWRAVAG